MKHEALIVGSGHVRDMRQFIRHGRGRGNTVGLPNEVGRNKPAQAGVSGKLTGQMPETVASRPYSGLRQILNSTVLPQGYGGERLWDHDKCTPNYNHNTPVILRRHFRNFHNRTFVWQPICLKPNFSLLFRKMFQP